MSQCLKRIPRDSHTTTPSSYQRGNVIVGYVWKRTSFGSRPRMTKPKRCVPPDEEPVRFLTIKPTLCRSLRNLTPLLFPRRARWVCDLTWSSATWQWTGFHLAPLRTVSIGGGIVPRQASSSPSSRKRSSSITTQPLSRTPPFFHSISRHSIHEDIMEAVPLRHRTPTNSIACLISNLFAFLRTNLEARERKNFVADSLWLLVFFPFFFFWIFVASDTRYFLFCFERRKIDF